MKGLAAAALAVIGIWAGLHFYSARRPIGIPVPAGSASAPGPSDFDSAMPAAGPAAAEQIPEKLPNFALADTAGKSTPIATWAGKSLIVNFWATWCAPCQREMPLLMAVDGEWHGRNVQVVGIAVDHPAQVAAYAKKMRIGYPLLVGEEDALDAAAKFGMASPVFPFTVFTDRQGRIVTLYVGELHRPQVDYILSVVDQLNADTVRLADARRAIAEHLPKLAT